MYSLSSIPRLQRTLATCSATMRILPLSGDPDEPESLLYEPSSFTTDGFGRYYVADTGNDRIAVLDSAGEYVRSIGGPGPGPGELHAPGALTDAPSFFIRDDELWIAVPERGVAARFLTDGTFLEEVSTAAFSPRGFAIAKTEEGGLVVWGLVNEQTVEGIRTRARIRVFDRDREVAAMLSTEPVPTAVFVKPPGEERRARRILNYASFPHALLVGSEEVVLSSGVEPVLSWYNLAGMLLRQARFDIPVEISERERAAVVSAIDEAIAVADEDGDESKAMMWRKERETLVFAERSAPWSIIKVDDAGYLWLFNRFGASGVAAERQHAYKVRIASPEGEYLGDTTLPPMPSNAVVGARVAHGLLLVILEDPETEEAVPTVYRIREAIEGFRYPQGPR